ncbi:YjcQ family protein [Salibacterium halotolerans]|uniref:YjcQ protein n=1 Tax=Salibacterium halotolerans TaxID=1884432 RepID=A0A1I5NAB0_9BACI|nr:YjcQ family protein [Salibacterium halotolerans]SFP18815.1 YjcQ protein [Salibacterium halotolerans]
MFKSTSEFHNALVSVLTSIMDNPENIDEWQGSLDEISFHDVLRESLDRGYLTGCNVQLAGDDEVTVVKDSPRLTYRGLEFLESNG